MPIWKQMRCLEVVAAIIAESLMEMNVKIYTSPEEIHWPMGCVTWPGSKAPTKSGKKINKRQGGVFGHIVYEYAPAKGQVLQVPQSTTKAAASVKLKGTRSTTTKAKTKSMAGVEQEVTETESMAHHEGLPVQERKCTL